MNAPFLESDATLHQTGRIADVLRANGIDAEIIRNEWEEPLAVVARNVLDTSNILGAVRLHQLDHRLATGVATDEESEERGRISEILPVAGYAKSLMLPASFLYVVDLAVQAALDRPDVLATQLNPVPLRADGVRLLDTHIDYSNQAEKVIETQPISGLNVHVVRGGSCTAIFGLVRSFADVQKIGAVKNQDSIAKQLGYPFTEPVELRHGDAAIFQAGPYRRFGWLPVAHEFLTTGGETRYSELYAPTDFAPTDIVQSLRHQIGRDYSLEAFGYAAA